MLVTSFPAGPWQANCYVVAREGSKECVVVDVGMAAREPLELLLTEHGLQPVAVLATHGHIDHIMDAAAVADAHDIPVHLHADEVELLTNPLAGLGPQTEPLLRQLLGTTELLAPADVRTAADGEVLSLAGIDFEVLAAPGHRPGCVVYRVAGDDRPLAFFGDVLFLGSIGRTDLPGGSMEQMARTLTEVVLPLADDVEVLPGHGPATTIGRERAANPYLQPDFLERYR